MAGAFLSSTVIRMVSERVLANVLEQLPRAARADAAPGEQTQPQVIANVMAIKRLEEGIDDLRSTVGRVEDRLDQLEHRLRWRTYLWILATALVLFAMGFGTAFAIQAIGA